MVPGATFPVPLTPAGSVVLAPGVRTSAPRLAPRLPTLAPPPVAAFSGTVSTSVTVPESAAAAALAVAGSDKLRVALPGVPTGCTGDAGRVYSAGGKGKLVAFDMKTGKPLATVDIAPGTDQIAYDKTQCRPSENSSEIAASVDHSKIVNVWLFTLMWATKTIGSSSLSLYLPEIVSTLKLTYGSSTVT